MEKHEIKIPNGCVVDTIITEENSVVVTFKKVEPKLPETWEEFCENNPTKENECWVDNYSGIAMAEQNMKRTMSERNMLPNIETAEAVLALCQLIQLRECYNQGWQPDSKMIPKPFTIDFCDGKIRQTLYDHLQTTPLYFKTAELRDIFLNNFRNLIEKIKPLYGIKKGGEE